MMASAPGRFSITTAWPHCLERPSPTSRAAVSITLPAGKGTITRTGRTGQALSASAAQIVGLIAAMKATNEGVLLKVPTPASFLLNVSARTMQDRSRCPQNASASKTALSEGLRLLFGVMFFPLGHVIFLSQGC